MAKLNVSVPNKKDIDKCKIPGIDTIGNEVLYDMCRKYPAHTNADEVFSKLWIIGRAYSASIERNKAGYSSDEIYESVVGSILARGDELDSKISALTPIIDYETMAEALGVHLLLMVIFEGATGLNKRSLASKYLHFHRPDVFYIYDSYANSALTKHVKGSGTVFGEKYDINYAKFCVKAHALRKMIWEQFGEDLTLREFDRLLLNLHRSK